MQALARCELHATPERTAAAAAAAVAAALRTAAAAAAAAAQGVSSNLMEFAWKTHVRVLHPTPASFSAFMGEARGPRLPSAAAAALRLHCLRSSACGSPDLGGALFFSPRAAGCARGGAERPGRREERDGVGGSPERCHIQSQQSDVF